MIHHSLNFINTNETNEARIAPWGLAFRQELQLQCARRDRGAGSVVRAEGLRRGRAMAKPGEARDHRSRPVIPHIPLLCKCTYNIYWSMY